MTVLFDLKNLSLSTNICIYMYAICNRATAICTLSEEPLIVNKYMYIAIYRASVLGLSVTTCNL